VGDRLTGYGLIPHDPHTDVAEAELALRIAVGPSAIDWQ